MGGGLAFLNKKTWHPSNMRNQEEVWKREQQAAAEAKKLDELRKQIDEERKKQEIMQVAIDAGHGPQETRLDWMYGGSMAAKEDAAKRQEEALMGKAVPLPEAPQEASRVDKMAQLPSFYTSTTPASQLEQWQRLANDPLVAIKRQEQEGLRKIRENPVQMQEILKEVQKLKGSSGSKKAKKDKKEKKEKKDKKEKKHKKDKDGGHQHSRSASPSPKRQRLEPSHGGSHHTEAGQRGPPHREGYGLSFGQVVPDTERAAREVERGASTRQRLEEAARKKEQEARELAAQRHQRKDYKTGKLTAEERAQRLAEMMSNADAHEDGRAERLRAARERDTRAEQAPSALAAAAAAAASGGRQDRFLEAATRDVYGGLTGKGATLESRINSRKHYNER